MNAHNQGIVGPLSGVVIRGALMDGPAPDLDTQRVLADAVRKWVVVLCDGAIDFEGEHAHVDVWELGALLNASTLPRRKACEAAWGDCLFCSDCGGDSVKHEDEDQLDCGHEASSATGRLPIFSPALVANAVVDGFDDGILVLFWDDGDEDLDAIELCGRLAVVMGGEGDHELAARLFEHAEEALDQMDEADEGIMSDHVRPEKCGAQGGEACLYQDRTASECPHCPHCRSLGRRAVEALTAKGLTLLPRMAVRFEGPDDCEYMSVVKHFIGKNVLVRWADRVTGDTWYAAESELELVMDDGPTKGGYLEQVRTAWGDPTLCVANRAGVSPNVDAWLIATESSPDHYGLVHFTAATEGLVLVVTMEGAP